MTRKTVLGILLLFTVSQATAELDAEIDQSCAIDYEPVISMEDPDSDTNNPGEPGYYQYNVCVQGIEESKFATSCEKNVGFHISSKNDTAHFSTQNSYYWSVCTDRMKTRVTTGPKYQNETALFSVSDPHNGHVAEPNLFDYNVYGSYEAPENITLSMEFNLSSSDQVYFDGGNINGEQSFYPPAEFPYVMSESDSFVAGIVSPEFVKAERTIATENTVSLTKSWDSGFIVPFTSGDRFDIEDKQQKMVEGTFLNSISPNFGFSEVETPEIRTLIQDSSINSELSLAPGSYRINVTKTGENQVEIAEVG